MKKLLKLGCKIRIRCIKDTRIENILSFDKMFSIRVSLMHRFYHIARQKFCAVQNGMVNSMMNTRSQSHNLLKSVVPMKNSSSSPTKCEDTIRLGGKISLNSRIVKLSQKMASKLLLGTFSRWSETTDRQFDANLES
jgi:hypothetical protein